MKKSEIRKVIENCIETQSQLQLERNKIDEQEITAIPISISKRMLLLKYIYDFQLDGIKVIQMRDISYVKSAEIEKFHNYIFKKENIDIKMNIPYNISIANWKSFFESICDKVEIIEIECEETRCKSFFIGKIITMDDELVKILEINPLGQWDTQYSDIYYKDITLVSLGTRYSTILFKYQNSGVR